MSCHARSTYNTSVPSPDPAHETRAGATACCDAMAVTAPSVTDDPAPDDPEVALRVVPEPHTEIAERRLLAAISGGSRFALRRLHSLYFSRLANFFRVLMPMSAAEIIDDLVADTMFDVWYASAGLALDTSVRVAIMRIAWKHGSKHLTRSAVHLSSPERLTSHVESTTSQSTGRDALRPWSDVVATLHANERAVVQLVHSGHSREEVADILSMPCHAIDAYLASAMIAVHPWLTAKYSATAGV